METLGDAVYMVAGGIPDRREKHTQRVAAVATELLEQVQTIKTPLKGQKTLRVRMGKEQYVPNTAPSGEI